MPQNLFAACRANGTLLAKRVRLDQTVQQQIEDIFKKQEEEFRRGITSEVAFDGSWKPDDHELLTIDVPKEADIFADTLIHNPISLPVINTTNFEQEGIKAVFTGVAANGAVKVLVQGFSPKQILSRRFSLWLHGDTFRRLSEPAFSLDTGLTCIIEDGKIKFRSFHKVRAIIDLQELYREATDQELQDFAKHPFFEVADATAFTAAADQTIRKLVHAIRSQGVLDKYTVDQIKAACDTVGVALDVNNNGKLVMPADRTEIKKLLHFLSDNLYKAQLSGDCYITNSKRRA